jgi:hypothetical protein
MVHKRDLTKDRQLPVSWFTTGADLIRAVVFEIPVNCGIFFPPQDTVILQEH